MFYRKTSIIAALIMVFTLVQAAAYAQKPADPVVAAVQQAAQEAAGATQAVDQQTDSAKPTETPQQPQEQDIQINEAGLFDIYLRNAPLADAVRMLSRLGKKNVTVSGSVTAAVSADLYRLSFEEALEGLLTPAGYVWFARGKFIYVCTPEEKATISNAGRSTELRILELNYIPVTEVLPIVTALISPAGVISSTSPPKVEGVALTADDFNSALSDGLGGKSRAVGEYLVIRDFPEVLDEIAHVLDQLDRRPRQVLIEAVILRARLQETNALGIDFNSLSGVDFRTLSTASTGALGVTPGAVPEHKFDTEMGAAATNFTGEVPDGGISLGIITNNVSMFIRALEEVVDLTIVANPKVLAVNEQPGRVIVGREDGYLTTTTTETATLQSIEFIQTGTQILFRPFIANDGTIRMDIHPEDSSGGLTPDNLPYKDTTEVTSNVMIKDGHTLVIGGLFREVTTSRATQVPWVGNIPVLGALLRGQNDNVAREEMIVLITPHIIEDMDDGESARAQEEVEHRRILAHRGLMPWGRERLAQAHYRWALEHQHANRTDKAVWDLELALMLNPRFIEADWLREELTGRAYENEDNSIVRGLIQEMIHERQGEHPDVPPPVKETPTEDEVAPADEAPAVKGAPRG